MTTEPRTTEHRTGALGWVLNRSGVNHFRVAEPLRVMATLGYHTKTSRELSNATLSDVDTVVTHMIHTPKATAGWAELARAGSHRMVIDVDDAMWCPDFKPLRRYWDEDNLTRLYHNVRIAHVVTVTTAPLAEHLSKINPNVHVIPNTVPQTLLWQRFSDPADPGPRLVYQGSPSHKPDWTRFQQRELSGFLTSHPGWGMNWYGADPGGLAGRPGIESFPWQPDIDRYYRTIRGDVGIGPLSDTPFNTAKSAIRAVEYAALGIVSVLPDLPPYRGWVEDGITGRLVGKGERLSRVLRDVAADPDWRARATVRSRTAAARWTTEHNIGRWIKAWDSL